MRLSYNESLIMQKTRRDVGLYSKGILTDHEVVSGLVVRLADERSGRVTRYCVAALPEELLGRLKGYLEELAATGYRGKVVTFGFGMSEATETPLASRFRAVAEEIRQFLVEIKERPTALDEAAALAVNVFWSFLRELPTDGNSPCGWPGCHDPSIGPSLYCARHHYEQMEGKPPPEE